MGTKRYTAVQIAGLILVVFALLFLRVSFLEKFTIVSPDHKISSAEAIQMINFIKISLILLGTLSLLFPLYYGWAKRRISNIRNGRKKDYKQIYLALILLILIIGYFFAIFISDFYFIKENERPSGKFGFLLYAYEAGAHFMKTFFAIVSKEDLDTSRIDIPVYKLFVRQEDIDRLNSDLPASGYEYVDGYLVYGNDMHAVKARYRGDSKLHWYFNKKSWRINLKDKQVIDSSEKFNLINPKYKSHMQTLLGYYISDELGIITPRSYHVALFLNNDYYGVYYYSDQIDELFISMIGKTPGDIYFGDNNESLFDKLEGAGRWDIMSVYDGNTYRARQNINYLISAVNANDIDFYRFFNRYLGDSYIKFYAYNILIGDAHVSEVANHKFYFDPENKTFEPIVWDQITFSSIELPLDSAHNSLFNRTSRIPQYMHMKNLYLKKFMEEMPESVIIEYIDNTSESMDYEITYDKYKDSPFPPWTLSKSEWIEATDELKDSVRARYGFVRKQLNMSYVNVSIAGNVAVFDVSGVSAVKADPVFNFKGEGCPRIYKDYNFNLVAEDDEILSFKCDRNKVYIDTQLLYPGKNGTLRYAYIMEEGWQIVGISVNAHNSITDAELSPVINFFSTTSKFPPAPETESAHPWALPPKK